MRRLLPFLPVFLALSTSSPYWQAKRTGLMGYRLAAYDELPRTGIPELFADEAEYRDLSTRLSAAGRFRTRATSGGRCGGLQISDAGAPDRR